MLSSNRVDTRDGPPGENATANEIAVHTFVNMAVKISNLTAKCMGNFSRRSQTRVRRQLDQPMMKNAGRHGEREHGDSVMIDHEDRAGRPAGDERAGAAWSRL